MPNLTIEEAIIAAKKWRDSHRLRIDDVLDTLIVAVESMRPVVTAVETWRDKELGDTWGAISDMINAIDTYRAAKGE